MVQSKLNTWGFTEKEKKKFEKWYVGGEKNWEQNGRLFTFLLNIHPTPQSLLVLDATSRRERKVLYREAVKTSLVLEFNRCYIGDVESDRPAESFGSDDYVSWYNDWWQRRPPEQSLDICCSFCKECQGYHTSPQSHSLMRIPYSFFRQHFGWWVPTASATSEEIAVHDMLDIERRTWYQLFSDAVGKRVFSSCFYSSDPYLWAKWISELSTVAKKTADHFPWPCHYLALVGLDQAVGHASISWTGLSEKDFINREARDFLVDGGHGVLQPRFEAELNRLIQSSEIGAQPASFTEWLRRYSWPRSGSSWYRFDDVRLTKIDAANTIDPDILERDVRSYCEMRFKPVIKRDAGAKIRLAVSADDQSYLILSYILDVTMSFPFRSPLTQQSWADFAETSTHSPWHMPYDYSAFDRQATKSEVLSVLRALTDRIAERSHPDVAALFKLWLNAANGAVMKTDTIFPWITGVPSGIRATSLIDTLLNACWMRAAGYDGMYDLMGDDCNLGFHSFEDAIRLKSQMAADGFSANGAKFYITHEARTEFGRRQWNGTSIWATYPSRSILAILQRKPWSDFEPSRLDRVNQMLESCTLVTDGMRWLGCRPDLISFMKAQTSRALGSLDYVSRCGGACVCLSDLYASTRSTTTALGSNAPIGRAFYASAVVNRSLALYPWAADAMETYRQRTIDSMYQRLSDKGWTPMRRTRWAVKKALSSQPRAGLTFRLSQPPPLILDGLIQVWMSEHKVSEWKGNIPSVYISLASKHSKSVAMRISSDDYHFQSSLSANYPPDGRHIFDADIRQLVYGTLCDTRGLGSSDLDYLVCAATKYVESLLHVGV